MALKHKVIAWHLCIIYKELDVNQFAFLIHQFWIFMNFLFVGLIWLHNNCLKLWTISMVHQSLKQRSRLSCIGIQLQLAYHKTIANMESTNIRSCLAHFPYIDPPQTCLTLTQLGNDCIKIWCYPSKLAFNKQNYLHTWGLIAIDEYSLMILFMHIQMNTF